VREPPLRSYKSILAFCRSVIHPLKLTGAKDLVAPIYADDCIERLERSEDDVVLQTSSTFWKVIEERRKEPTMSIKELRTRLKKRKK
jgi:hypothetical protein